MSDDEDDRDYKTSGRSKTCTICDKSFGKIRKRRKKCKVCGQAVCWECSPRKVVFGQLSKPVRVCNRCIDTVTGTDGCMTLPVSQVKVRDKDIGKFMLAIDLGLYDPRKGPISLVMQSGRSHEVHHPKDGPVNAFGEWIKINNGQEEVRFYCEAPGLAAKAGGSFFLPFMMIIVAMSLIFAGILKDDNTYMTTSGAVVLLTVLWKYAWGGTVIGKVHGPHNCALHIRSIESASANSAIFEEEDVKEKMSYKWCFGALEGYDVKKIDLSKIGKAFAGEWALDKDRKANSKLGDVMQATGLPAHIHRNMNSHEPHKIFKMEGTTMRVTTTMPGTSATVKKQQSALFNLDGKIHSEPHPTNKGAIIMVRHFVDGLDFVTQAVYCDSGNSQEIRRSVIDGGRTVLVHNTVTKRDSAEAVSTDRYYTKIVM